MTAKTITSVDAWTSPATAAFEYWVSFWPAAPLFGVEWRFADFAVAFIPWAGIEAVHAKKTAVRDKAARAGVKPVTIEVKYAEVQKPAPTAEAPRPSARKSASKAAARRDETPVTEAPAAEAPRPADDLKLIKGIGPGLERQLNALGFRNFSQIAALTEKELAALDEKLTTIKGRCFRDDWVGQAKALAV